jgi:endoglucanase
MFEKTDRKRVKGFLRANGKEIVNEDGEPIILTGWGLGNWLLPEGYMWLSHTNRFDRPRRIEAVIRELTGSEYAESFWKHFRNNYVTREDIRLMAQLGYNSVRIPIGWRILMEDEPGITWIENGFALIDKCLDWCEEFGLYAFLDLHGAPGGQTGANIDDSIDDFPRLFTDDDSWHKCMKLWMEIARRYEKRWIVGGYDLLNEPIRPGLYDDKRGAYLIERLAMFYEEVIARIRKIDAHHLISVEGHHWATNTAVFHKRYDDNMVIHFHRYACMPGLESFQEYLQVSDRLNLPLWLGETGENTPEWYAAMYPLAVSLGIGYNLWPWKKMECDNSPYSVNKPEGWDTLLAYTEGNSRPNYEQAQKILDQLLENIRVENCTPCPEVTAAAFRRPGCSLRGTDFDEFPGKDISFSGLREGGNLYSYRSNTGMYIRSVAEGSEQKRFVFDSGWDLLALEMDEGEFAAYTFNLTDTNCVISLQLRCLLDAEVSIHQDTQEIARIRLDQDEQSTQIEIPLQSAMESTIKVHIHDGKIQLFRVQLNLGDRIAK